MDATVNASIHFESCPVSTGKCVMDENLIGEKIGEILWRDFEEFFQFTKDKQGKIFRRVQNVQ